MTVEAEKAIQFECENVGISKMENTLWHGFIEEI